MFLNSCLLNRNAYKVSVGKLEGTDCLIDLSIDEKIIYEAGIAQLM
jgi:hypothetical protein